MADSNQKSSPSPWGYVMLLVAVAAVTASVVVLQQADHGVPQDDEVAQPSAELPRIPFTDVTAAAGITFVHRSGAEGEKLLPESGGSGAAVFDYDGDGDPDLVLINGRDWSWSQAARDQPADTLALYRNDGGGRFVDVSAEAGLEAAFLGQGVAVGDYDADGDDDLFVTALGGNHLYRNDDGRFVEVTAEAGVAGDENDWTTSTGFFDYDRDGDLDLFVCNYVRWTREVDNAATRRVVSEFLSYAHPENFEGTQNYLFRNDGGRFTDVSADAGIHVTDPDTGQAVGKALAVTFADVDRDGWLDVLVANDAVRHFLFHNRGDGTFEEVGQSWGFAFNADGAATSGMGVDAAWPRNNDELDVAVGNFANEMTELFVRRPGEGSVFSDQSVAAGVGGPTRMMLTWGLLFDDFDLDGRVDLVHANGHLENEINRADSAQRYAQPGELFWNTGDEQPLFAPLPAANVGDLAKPFVGRGIASADFDADGDLDLLLTQVDGPPLLLRNDGPGDANWLRCRLEGPPGNPHAIGAAVELEAGGVTQRRFVMPTRGYLSQSEPVLTFGLGDAKTVDRLTITWPDGTRQETVPDGTRRVLTIRQEVVRESFAALANKSKAELENGNYDGAIQLLEAARAQRPDSLPIRRNLARAYVLSGRVDEAIAVLQQLEAEALRPSATTAYLLGLAAVRQLEYQQAADHFAKAVELDPNEATLHFQLALALTSLGRTDEARQSFEKAAELDPLHGGAQYQLAVIARRAGNLEAFRGYMRDFERIRALKGTVDAAALEECRYTQAEAIEPEDESRTASIAADAEFSTVDLATDSPAELENMVALAVFDLLETGRYQLVGVTSDGRAVLFAPAEDLQPHLITTSEFALGELAGGAAVLVARAIDDQTLTQLPAGEAGDQPEIAVVTPERTWLLHYRSDSGFTDLTEKSGLGAAKGTAARWVDLDHDGDVDLCTASADGVTAWRNNSDGTFVDATDEFGLDGFGPILDFGVVDLDATNLGVDLAMVGPDGASLARNQYGGAFASEPATAAAWPAAPRILADDFDNDGAPDLMFITAQRLTLIQPGTDRRQQIPLPLDQLDGAATIDVDNDGWLDVAVCGAAGEERRTLLVRNAGGRLVETQDPELAPYVGPLRGDPLDLDAENDGDTDLLLINGEGQLNLLRNDTATDNRQLKLALRSFVGHPSSIGVRVQLRREGLLVTRFTQRELPIEIGVGPHDQADSIQTLWLNGIAKNEIGVALTNEPMWISIIEFVRTSSCPFLYAWVDGQWQFVTDLLGTAPLNVAMARGVPMPPDPDEVVVLGPAERFTNADLTARLRITSELREVVYLNQARLLAVDHPADATVFSRDRAAMTAVDGPQLAVGRAPRELLSAVGSDGARRTEALAAEDGVMAEPGRLLPPPLVGFTRPLALELDFGELDDSADYLLVLTGWFRFGNSSSNIAASQRGDLEVIWPKLEAGDAEGRWHLVEEMVGFPAGNTKTIVCDLKGKLPPGARRLRLTTSFEVRWDHAALYQSVPAGEVRVTELEPAAAELAWHGFAELHAARFDLPHVPNLARRSDEPPWQTTVEGWCTRYGDVRPLVTAADEQLAVLNSGDGATLDFAADALPARNADMARTLLLYTRGWIKEEDPNSLEDRGVSPLPDQDLRARANEDDWQLEYNTRWIPRARFRPD